MGPWAGSKKPWSAAGMLSVRAPSTHNTLSLPNPAATVTELSPAGMKQGSVQVSGTEDSYAYLHPNLCVTAVTEQCMIQLGEESCVWFLYTLGY